MIQIPFHLACRKARTRYAVCAAFAAIVCLAGGCGAKLVTVTGTVQYEGKAIETGEISFVAQDSSDAPAGAVISDGKYTASMSPGEKIVRVRASRLIPSERRGPHDPAGLREDFLPAKFNDESTITVTIGSQANQTHDFDLDDL